MDAFRYALSKWVYGYHVVLQAIRRLELAEDSTLLYLGSGFGKTAMMAAELFRCKVVGADLAPVFVDRANRRAQERGLADHVRFLQLDPERPFLNLDVDGILFESLLSFLGDPGGALTYYSGRIRGDGRMGVIEVTFLEAPTNSAAVQSLKEVFGEEANFRDESSWLRLFEESGLQRLEGRARSLGLGTKFWDDLMVEPIGTLVDLGKTLYAAHTKESGKRSMRLFRRFFREYSKTMVCASHILTKTAG